MGSTRTPLPGVRWRLTKAKASRRILVGFRLCVGSGELLSRAPMNTARHAVVALAIGAMACGGASDPGEGTFVAHLTSNGTAISVSVDRGDVYVVLIDAAGSLRISVDRVRGSDVTTMPMAAPDWSDYASGIATLDAAKSAVVSDGKAYFLGQSGVTVVPLDGSPSRTLYEPDPQSPTRGHAFNVLGAFAVDGESIYVCDSDLTTATTNFGRFDADGTWELLFAGSLPAQDETCFDGAMAVDASAVYWSTSQAIRAYSKRNGTVTTVVDLQELADAPTLLAVDDSSVAWFDMLDLAFHVADKKRTTPSTSAALGATALTQLAPSDLTPLSLLAMGSSVYWLTGLDLHRLPKGGGSPDVLAHRPQQGGEYMGLATDGKQIYFTDSGRDGDGGSGEVTLRSVSL